MERMTPRPDGADASDFTAVDHSPDPSAMIAMMDSLRPLNNASRSVLLDRLHLEGVQSALDVGCGTGDDLMEMARRLPPGCQVEGVDSSEAMISEARRRAAAAGVDATFRVADALSLPYPDGAFDVCRMKTVLVHVADARQAVREMVRVTRPGGQVGALEMDNGSMVLDHPDLDLTRSILDAVSASRVHPFIGRQLHRLFRAAGLTGVTGDPIAFPGHYQVIRRQFEPVVTRLCDEGVITVDQAGDWWSWLAREAEAGALTGAATAFVVTGTRPL